ncbi:non-hydrolyzing UDP-N-acetylglucosamine 2-epimerase [Marivirga arenosa]|uniref:UDP-N-acetylglucosamine 2-epimerase (Non-hydrolyzing) n=1 Tax=Marivirga arenosa TaxID=3059076 RepID=A0AA51ZVZ6_9BACT|nr:UDP-N-acetylglucosamine 2-epimerase (non-hydrolyzing) [Marivirga sp. BKB1-2]WNB17746.1 UDP-N-acetylglucosamine 2-epimerase (non-hydrolyzing) [Marivirga sp. BKB1-2]
MKILTVIGARPQFIKAAVVSKAILDKPGVEEIVVHTGQHFDPNMSEIFFNQLNIPKPKYNYNINGMSHGAMTGKMLEKIEETLLAERPDVVLVYGDTNSTLAGALAAKKLHIKVAHVEAGLRSFNMEMPEEINRILTDRVSDVLFCPTETAINNLKNEGYANFDCEIVNSGDVMYDSSLLFKEISDKDINNSKNIPLTDYVLGTIHRAENTDDTSRLKSIIEGLNEIHNTLIKVLVPLHPRTRKIISDNNIDIDFEIIDPVGYLEMLQLISKASLIITDSGGLQKEAYFFKKLCVTMRDQTEWIELIKNNYNVLVGANHDRIVEKTKEFLEGGKHFDKLLYGNGKSASKIVNHLFDNL